MLPPRQHARTGRWPSDASAQRLPKAAQRGPRPPLVPVQVLVQPPTHSYQRSESGEQLICYTMQRQPDRIATRTKTKYPVLPW